MGKRRVVGDLVGMGRSGRSGRGKGRLLYGGG